MVIIIRDTKFAGETIITILTVSGEMAIKFVINLSPSLYCLGVALVGYLESSVSSFNKMS